MMNTKKSQHVSLSSMVTGVVALVIMMSQMTPGCHAQTWTNRLEGPMSIGCTDGSCTLTSTVEETGDINGFCTNYTIPEDATSLGDGTYEGINGDFLLRETCTATCTSPNEAASCVEILGADGGQDTEDNPCSGGGGYVYCPETDECIRPWMENCPFEGESFKGPGTLTCEAGARCNDLNTECTIAVGSATIGGPYLTGLEGEYVLPKGCTATCEGCEFSKSNAAPILVAALWIIPSMLVVVLTWC